jgi:hypothetical protein
MPPLAPPKYTNTLVELKPHESKEAAEKWLKDNRLNVVGTTVLIPFNNDEVGRIEFLKFRELPDEHGKDRLRIMGAGNEVEHKGLLYKFTERFTGDIAPHLNDLCGTTITLADGQYAVIYERGDKHAGKEFAKLLVELFPKQTQDLLEEIKATQINDTPGIKPAEFIEAISKLAMNRQIRWGMTYFIVKDEQGKDHLYRHTFKENVNNTAVLKCLNAEKKDGWAVDIRVKNNKSTNHHRFAFFIDCVKWIITAVVIGLLTGLIVAVPVVFFIGMTLAGIVGGAIAGFTFLGVSSFGLARASKQNEPTIVFGQAEFIPVEKKISVLARIKLALQVLFGITSSAQNTNASAVPVDSVAPVASVASAHHDELAVLLPDCPSKPSSSISLPPPLPFSGNRIYKDNLLVATNHVTAVIDDAAIQKREKLTDLWFSLLFGGNTEQEGTNISSNKHNFSSSPSMTSTRAS